MTLRHFSTRLRIIKSVDEPRGQPVSRDNPDQVRPDQSSTTNSTPQYVSQVREWIEACDKQHGSLCVPEPVSKCPAEDVPLWLVDTQQQCIVPGLSAHQYLALSYVWPETRGSSDTVETAPRTLLLDSESMADFQKPGFLTNERIAPRVPMVIRHAMELTHVLGVRHLWVDRLCIVQNDFGNGGTLSQVAKMDKIYAGAYLTVIAAAPANMYGNGLAREWSSFESVRRSYLYRRRGLPRFIDAIRKPATIFHKFPEISKGEVTEAMSARYSELSRSKWASRGWTYQEQILCKRAVVFIQNGVFWDCHCCLWDGVNLLTGQHYADASVVALRADMGQRFYIRWWPDFSFYLDLVCPYNGREFSYPQDAMLGFSGILSALEISFRGGFIHGLPRLFLDHTLLWQPFGTVNRRMDRVEDDATLSSLPSWSWCGWQGFIDPLSLCSGLSYMHEKEYRDRAGSWCTRNLVELRLSIGDQTSEPVLEPRMLDQYVDISRVSDIKVPNGWVRQKVSKSDFKKESVHAGPVFTHAKDKNTYFRYPVPLKEDLLEQNVITTPAYLTFSTTTASLFPATVLKRRSTTVSTWTAVGPSKISVYEDKTFKRGPANKKVCPILVLQQPNGAFAGLLRLMSDNHIDEATPLELIAISTGSANVRDLRKSLEWRLFETGYDEYRDSDQGQTFHYEPEWISDRGKYALMFDVAMAFDEKAARNEPLGWKLDQVVAEVDQRNNAEIAKPGSRYPKVATLKSFCWGAWFAARINVLQEQTENARRKNPDFNQEEVVCEFYNVLWIERKDGIMYRRACGWVPKYIWEAYAAGPVEVKLG